MNDRLKYERADDAIIFTVKVVPGAARDQIVGPYAHTLKVKVAAPPEAGKANRAVCALIARKLALPRSSIKIISGHTSPIKRLLARGATADAIKRLAQDRYEGR